jgi:hypothetical protein
MTNTAQVAHMTELAPDDRDARMGAPRKHPVDDPPPVSPNPVAPVDEPTHHEPPVEEPDDEEPADT